MLKTDVVNTINTWTSWANAEGNKRYDIALLKIWIQFEKFIAALFTTYAIGNSSEEGFAPSLKIRFSDEEQLNAFLRDGNKKYVDYPAQIKKLSKYIFQNNPFDIIFADSEVTNAYDQIVSLRNYLVHESGESKLKLIKSCFSGNDSNFIEPNDFLQQHKRSTGQSYYTYYIETIKKVVTLLINPPQ